MPGKSLMRISGEPKRSARFAMMTSRFSLPVINV